jgi:hypothetical protein
MRRIVSAVGLISVIMLMGCSTMRITSDYDPTAIDACAHYKTYAWLDLPKGDDPRVHNDLLETAIVSAVDTELAAWGYTEVTHGSPDFLIGYHIDIQGKLSVTHVNDYYGYNYGYWAPRYGAGYSQTYVDQYDEGTLLLDIIDGKSNKLVWRSTARAELNEYANPRERRERLESAVQKMLSDFPPEE